MAVHGSTQMGYEENMHEPQGSGWIIGVMCMRLTRTLSAGRRRLATHVTARAYRAEWTPR